MINPKLIFCLLLIGLCPFRVQAGGSIGWSEVRVRIAKTDPELVRIIDKNFIVNPSGLAVRLGHQFGERVGERIPPYDFEALRRATRDHYRLQIQESEDFELTGRYRFTWELLSDKK